MQSFHALEADCTKDFFSDTLSETGGVAMSYVARIVLLALVLTGFSHACRAETGMAASDSRLLTADEVRQFLPLVCTDAKETLSKIHEKYHCSDIPGHNNERLHSTEGYELSLNSAIFGHLSSADQNEAYVTYHSNFEGHVAGFGGGILFRQQNNRWQLVEWYPGGKRNNCIVLSNDRPLNALCLGTDGHSEGPESWISVAPIIPDSSTQAQVTFLLNEAVDISPPYETCAEAKDPEMSAWTSDPCVSKNDGINKSYSPILLQFKDLKRSKSAGIFAEAFVKYITVKNLENACEKTCFIDAKRSEGRIEFILDGSIIRTVLPHGL